MSESKDLSPVADTDTDIKKEITEAMSNFPKPPPAAFRAFKKCKSATFSLDGTLYTIGKLINYLHYISVAHMC